VNEKKVYYAQVNNHHVEEVCDVNGNEQNNILAICIDGYKTDDDNEEGSVIAKVLGVKRDSGVQVFVEYHTVEARIDERAQEAIQEAVKIIPSMFDEHESKGEVTPVTDLDADDIAYTKEVLNAVQEAKYYADQASDKLLLLKGVQGEEIGGEISKVYKELERIELKLMATYPQINEQG
jgi:hypothetical protein